MYPAQGGWGAGAGPSPSALRRASSCQAQPPSWQAGLTPAGPEQAQLLVLTFKTTTAMCACPPPPPPTVSHFQTGQLVWFEPSADLPAGGGQPGEAAAGGVGGQACSSREETRQVFLLV